MRDKKRLRNSSSVARVGLLRHPFRSFVCQSLFFCQRLRDVQQHNNTDNLYLQLQGHLRAWPLRWDGHGGPLQAPRQVAYEVGAHHDGKRPRRHDGPQNHRQDPGPAAQRPDAHVRAGHGPLPGWVYRVQIEDLLFASHSPIRVARQVRCVHRRQDVGPRLEVGEEVAHRRNAVDDGGAHAAGHLSEKLEESLHVRPNEEAGLVVVVGLAVQLPGCLSGMHMCRLVDYIDSWIDGLIIDPSPTPDRPLPPSPAIMGKQEEEPQPLLLLTDITTFMPTSSLMLKPTSTGVNTGLSARHGGLAAARRRLAGGELGVAAHRGRLEHEGGRGHEIGRGVREQEKGLGLPLLLGHDGW